MDAEPAHEPVGNDSDDDESPLTLEECILAHEPYYVPTQLAIEFRALCNRYNRPELSAHLDRYCKGPALSGSFIRDVEEMEAYDKGNTTFLTVLYAGELGDMWDISRRLEKFEQEMGIENEELVGLPHHDNSSKVNEDYQEAIEAFNFEFRGMSPPVAPNPNPTCSILQDHIFELREMADVLPDYTEVLSAASPEGAALWLETMKELVPERLRHYVTFELLGALYMEVVHGVTSPGLRILDTSEATNTSGDLDMSRAVDGELEADEEESMDLDILFA